VHPDEILSVIGAYAPVAQFPWGELEAQGKGYASSDAYIDVMQAKFDEYFKTIWKLDIPELQFGGVSDTMAQAAYDFLADSIKARAGVIYEALQTGQLLLAAKDAIEVPAEALKIFLVLLNSSAWAGFSSHEAGGWRYAISAGLATEAEAKDSIQNIYRLWDAVIRIEGTGALDPLKRAQFKGQAGLGDFGLSAGVVVVLAIATVLIVCIIAYALVTIFVELNRTKMVEKSCFDAATGKLVVPLPAHCKKYYDNLANDPNSHLAIFLKPLTDAADKLVNGILWIAGGAAVLYVAGVYVFPSVLASVSSHRSFGGRRELGPRVRGALPERT
jgi:hypothetical protein